MEYVSPRRKTGNHPRQRGILRRRSVELEELVNAMLEEKNDELTSRDGFSRGPRCVLNSLDGRSFFLCSCGCRIIACIPFGKSEDVIVEVTFVDELECSEVIRTCRQLPLNILHL